MTTEELNDIFDREIEKLRKRFAQQAKDKLEKRMNRRKQQ